MRKFFEGFDFAVSAGATNGKGTNGISKAETLVEKPEVSTDDAAINWRKELGAYRMILGYRNKGHLIAKTNPIRERGDRGANLNPAFFGFTEEDLDKNFQAGNLIGLGNTTLRNIIENVMGKTYEQIFSEFE